MADDDFDDDSRESVYSLAPEDILFQARCIYPFEGTCDVELTLNEGDVINVTRTDVGGGWWEGEFNGNHGLFPESYVEPQVGEKGAWAVKRPKKAASPTHCACACATTIDAGFVMFCRFFFFFFFFFVLFASWMQG